MINIYQKCNICIELNCKSRASYNLQTEIKPLYCFIHKKEYMINTYQKFNICIELNCNSIANYNLIGEKNALYCNEHKKINMFHIRVLRCVENLCNNYSAF